MNDTNSITSSFHYLRTNVTDTDSSSAFITSLNKRLNNAVINDDSSNEFIINSKKSIQSSNSQNKLEDSLGRDKNKTASSNQAASSYSPLS